MNEPLPELGYTRWYTVPALQDFLDPDRVIQHFCKDAISLGSASSYPIYCAYYQSGNRFVEYRYNREEETKTLTWVTPEQIYYITEGTLGKEFIDLKAILMQHKQQRTKIFHKFPKEPFYSSYEKDYLFIARNTPECYPAFRWSSTTGEYRLDYLRYYWARRFMISVTGQVDNKFCILYKTEAGSRVFSPGLTKFQVIEEVRRMYDSEPT